MEYLEGSDGEETIEEAKNNPVRIARLTVAFLRAEHGLLRDNVANRMVISTAARRYMKERGMRPTHISQFFQVAVDAYMMDSVNDEWLRKVRSSRRGRQLRRLGGEAL